MGELPRVSILVPTLDAERDLARLLPALARQEFVGGHELIVVDSDSSDGTRELLDAAGARVSRIERSAFGHGRTRNELARQASGELLLFLSQDAVPDDEHFVRHLLAPFDDPRVAGVTARVLPHEDDDPLTARTVLEAPEAAPDPSVRELAPGEEPTDVRFNNVASMIRASVLAELPFPDVAFGEDSAWAEQALRAGHRIAFAADAVVRHAHRYTPAQAYERYRVDAAFHRATYGTRTRAGLWDLLRGVAYEMRADVRFVRRQGRGWGHLLRSPALRSAQVFGQWVGSRGE